MEKTLKYIFGESALDLEAKFLPEVIELNYIDAKTKVKNTKFIAYEPFFQAVNRQVKLKTNLMAPGVRYMSRKDGRTYVLVENGATNIEMTFHDKHSDKENERAEFTAIMPVPPLLVGISMIEGQGITDAQVWALKEPVRELTDMVYEFPFGNSYGVTGKFCWGSSTKFFKDIMEVNQLRSIFSLIYGSKFNSDLQARFNISQSMTKENGKEIKTVLDFWKFLKDKEKFPNDCLVEAHSVKSCIRYLEDGRDF